MRNLCDCRHSHSRRSSMPCGVCCTQLTVWQHRVVCVAHLGNRLSFASPPLSFLSAWCCHPPATSWGTLILTRSAHGTRMRFARKLVHVADETKRACLSPSPPLYLSLSLYSLSHSFHAVVNSITALACPPAKHILVYPTWQQVKGVAVLC